MDDQGWDYDVDDDGWWMIKGGEDTSFYQEEGAVHTHYFNLSAHHVVLS